MVCPFHRELKPISADFHPFDPAQKANPYPLYARAHEESPVFFSPDINMWVVTKHKDIMEIARDPERFSSMGFTDRIGTLVREALAILAEGRPMLPTLINNDAPAHSRIRALCNKAFTPRRVAGMEPTIRELAHSLVDEFAHEGRAASSRASPSTCRASSSATSSGCRARTSRSGAPGRTSSRHSPSRS